MRELETERESQTERHTHTLSHTQVLPGTSGNLRSFKSSIFVAKVKREDPVTMATPVPYGE